MVLIYSVGNGHYFLDFLSSGLIGFNLDMDNTISSLVGARVKKALDEFHDSNTVAQK